MSLLADMLSKITLTEREGRGVDVPPGLRRTVSDYTKKEANKQRVFILSFLITLFIASGIASFYFAEYVKPNASDRNKDEGGRIRIAEHEDRNKQAAPKGPQSEAINQVKQAATIGHEQETEPKTTEMEKRHDTANKDNIPDIIKKEVKPARKAAGKIETGKKEALEKQPVTSKDSYLYMAGAAEKRKDYAGAIDNYKNVLEADPYNYVVLNNMANLLIHLGSYELAIEYSKKALDIKKDHIASLINTGIAYMKTENYAEGKRYLLQALSIEPTSRYALFNIALLFEKTGDYHKGNEYFQTLANMGDIQGYLGMGRIAEKEERVAAAIKIYKDILSMSLADPQIKMHANERIVVLEQL